LFSECEAKEGLQGEKKEAPLAGLGFEGGAPIDFTKILI